MEVLNVSKELDGVSPSVNKKVWPKNNWTNFR